uniref:Uncharacterized protein n=2 Tax=Rhodopseudomonas palustris (strain ATCC BAA-98 / CGA009) TaxID=258594 RepID=Q6N6T3_RHOPA|nr:hypothetical protein RPA2531 [Rhodopseudomonas palustris CGA009]
MRSCGPIDRRAPWMDLMDNPHSKLERVKYRGRETVTHLATVDDLICHSTNEGGAVLDFIVYGADGKALESFRATLCPEDLSRVKGISSVPND